jgi:hypothetical protein
MANIRNISNDGIWYPGDTVSFEALFINLPEALPTNSEAPVFLTQYGSGTLYLCSNNDATLSLGSSDIELGVVGMTEEEMNGWFTISCTIPFDTPTGIYYIKWVHRELDYTHGESVESDWEFYEITVGLRVSFFIPDPIVPPRPKDYDPYLGWDEKNSVWTPTIRGGGRYRQQFIAIGEEGEIYYGDA